MDSDWPSPVTRHHPCTNHGGRWEGNGSLIDQDWLTLLPKPGGGRVEFGEERAVVTT